MKLPKARMLNVLIIGVIVLVVASITAGLGGQVLDDIHGPGSYTSVNSTYLSNSTEAGMKGVNTIASYFPTIGTVLAIVVVLGLLLTELYGRVKGAL